MILYGKEVVIEGKVHILFPISVMKPINEIILNLKNQCILLNKSW
jgi:hypothetical protein